MIKNRIDLRSSYFLLETRFFFVSWNVTFNVSIPLSLFENVCKKKKRILNYLCIDVISLFIWFFWESDINLGSCCHFVLNWWNIIEPIHLKSNCVATPFYILANISFKNNIIKNLYNLTTKPDKLVKPWF